MKNKFLGYFAYLLVIVGISLTAINIYGLNKNIRPVGLFEDELRFENDITLNYEQAKSQLIRLESESDYEYAKRTSEVISKSIAHIHWQKEQDASKYNQLVPIWENYFLYFMGKFSGIPEYEKYHFADYNRSIRRGIGICGDASMIMSQLLEKQGISNQIITFPGHVVIAATFDDEEEFIFDPDFGVTLPYSPDNIQQSPSLVNRFYQDFGYTGNDLIALNHIYDNPYKRWDGVRHFITKKYYFEKIAYWLKWPLPLVLIMGGLLIIGRAKVNQAQSTYN